MYTPKFTSPPVLTVSQIDNYIRSVVQSDPRLMNVIVTGEITDMKSPFSGAKHNYFMLKDSGAVISAAMFIGDARRVVFRPENGLKRQTSAYHRGYAARRYRRAQSCL